MKYLKFFKLKEEAHLFDSKIYILKAFFAVLTAYVIALWHPLLRLDIISILFGLMMTLEPVTVSGIRSGWEQIIATVMGASVTTIIISIFGINSMTVALAVCFTLYVGIRINWRTVSPVAIFTSIYMTQFVQLTVGGLPSPLLTFRLRIVALVFGVGIAIFYNYIFSLFAYKKLPHKRLLFLLQEQIRITEQLIKAITTISDDALKEAQRTSQKAFDHIDWLLKHLEDLKKDNQIFKKQDEDSIIYWHITLLIRKMNHLNMDIGYILSSSFEHYDIDSVNINMIDQYEEALYFMEILYKALLKGEKINQIDIKKRKEEIASNRLEENIQHIFKIVQEILIKELACKDVINI